MPRASLRFLAPLVPLLVASHGAWSDGWGPVASGTTSLLNAVHFADATEGWAAGPSAVLRHTTDGGATWTSVDAGVPAANGFNSVRFSSRDVGWAGGLYVVTRTTDRGVTWGGSKSLPTSRFRNGTFPVSPTVAWSVGGQTGTNVFFRYTVQADGTLGEETWTLSSSSTLVKVFFPNPAQGWAVGNNGRIVAISNASAATPTLTPQTSGTPNGLSGIFMLDGTTGWVAGSAGTIRKTTDGGATWTPGTSGTSEDLNAVVFASSEQGWAAGTRGTIVATTDGGTSWKIEPSGVTVTLRALALTSSSVWAAGDGGTLLQRPFGAVAGRPAITSVQPNAGPIAGGSAVLLAGRLFQPGAAVTFGESPASDVKFVSPGTITATAPPHAAGAVAVTVTNPDRVTASLPGGFTYLESGTGTKEVLVPIVLTSSGLGGAFFTSELTLTNRGSTAAGVELAYTAALGGGGGTAADTLAPGEQRTVADAIAYLRSRGVAIPDSGNRGGTLLVRFTGLSSAADASATARTATAVPEGRAGLAYSGVPSAAGLVGPVWICGLRQNAADRSNLALLNAGREEDGGVTLEVTVFSGDPGTPASRVLDPIPLAPGGFTQLTELLRDPGFSDGYARVRRIAGTAPFFSYGVINDQANGDGSFVPPLPESALAGRTGLTLPVAVETSAFSTEMVLTNFTGAAKSVRLELVADAVSAPGGSAAATLSLAAGEQRIIPGFVQFLRDRGVPGIGPAGPTIAGAVFATVEGAADVAGLFVGARTSAAATRGRYGLFYTATPRGLSSVSEAWVHSLKQDGDNRANLALVNTGESGDDEDAFRVDVFDGATGTFAGTREGITLGARRWTQIGLVLSAVAPGTANAYARVTRTGGTNPFLTYGVVNDGGAPGERSGDGAFVPSEGACSYGVSPASFALGAAGGTKTIAVTAPAGCPWSAGSRAAWLAASSGSTGFGAGSVTFAGEANPDPAPRSGTLRVAGAVVQVTQSGKPVPGPYDGTWSGTTQQSRPFAFTILNNQVTSVTLGLDVTVGLCRVQGTGTASVDPPADVTNASFEFSTSFTGNGGLVQFTVKGVLASTTSANGTFDVVAIIGGGGFCFGGGSPYTWTATRQ